MDIDFVLGAKSRVRIIRELYNLSEINTTDLARRLGINYSLLEEHLKVLKEAGIVEEHRIGRIRLVSLRKEPKILQLAKILAELATE
ncbi:regulatory protein, ArsR [Thermoproteus uzoniensis 768-20]|uniref:Regulatory protein, ArsR n=1 Tax=Thermoproteus uzoniensis (strain 768-20) TaxID=999630 RepID=F2L2Y5_THEU7|nr:winged helix-turn-helix domain-containing protein [Thermoproteus uzoniensis]AEA13104.1 regulatory protein, ArsR [Thermoproteus uzoniensis 768-20]